LRVVARTKHEPDGIEECGLGAITGTSEGDESLIDGPFAGLDSAEVLDGELPEPHFSHGSGEQLVLLVCATDTTDHSLLREDDNQRPLDTRVGAAR